MFTVPLQYEIS